MKHGWSSYVCDTRHNVINIIDPQSLNGTTSFMKDKHEVCADTDHCVTVLKSISIIGILIGLLDGQRNLLMQPTFL